jgi:Acetyltransferase (GNAT) domain
MQSGDTVARSGLGFYSAREFDFTPYAPIGKSLLELGRACIHKEHRTFIVISLLWKASLGMRLHTEPDTSLVAVRSPLRIPPSAGQCFVNSVRLTSSLQNCRRSHCLLSRFPSSTMLRRHLPARNATLCSA